MLITCRAALFEQLLQEECSPEGFRIVKEKGEYNAIVSFKEDVENPIFRVDALVERVTPRQILEVLRDQAAVQSWFGKQLQSKLLPATAPDGSEIFSTLYKNAYPLNNREVIHRRLLSCDDAR